MMSFQTNIKDNLMDFSSAHYFGIQIIDKSRVSFVFCEN